MDGPLCMSSGVTLLPYFISKTIVAQFVSTAWEWGVRVEVVVGNVHYILISKTNDLIYTADEELHSRGEP